MNRITVVALISGVLTTSCFLTDPKQGGDPNRIFITLETTSSPIDREWIAGVMTLPINGQADVLTLQAHAFPVGDAARYGYKSYISSSEPFLSAMPCDLTPPPFPLPTPVCRRWEHAGRLVATHIPTNPFATLFAVINTSVTPNRFEVNGSLVPFSFATDPIGASPKFSISSCVRRTPDDLGDPCDSALTFWRPFLPHSDAEFVCNAGVTGGPPKDPGCDFDFSGCDIDDPLNTVCPRFVAELRVARNFHSPKGTRGFLPNTNTNCVRPFSLGDPFGFPCAPEAFKVFARDAGVNMLGEFGAPNPSGGPQMCHVLNLSACGQPDTKIKCTVKLPGKDPVCNRIDGDVEGRTDEVLKTQGVAGCGEPGPACACTDIGTCTFPNCAGLHTLWSCPQTQNPTVWVVQDLHDGGGTGEGPFDTCGCRNP